MDEGHKTRIALNEATYRKVNETMPRRRPGERDDGRLRVRSPRMQRAHPAQPGRVRARSKQRAAVRDRARSQRPRGSRTSSSATAATRTFEKHADVDDVRQAHGPA